MTGPLWVLWLLLATGPAEDPPEGVFPSNGSVARIVHTRPGPPGIRFSHVIHTDPVLGTPCDVCHAAREPGHRSRLAPDEVCKRCHEKDNRFAEYKESLKGKARPDRPASLPPLHGQHALFACIACHSNTLRSETIGDFELPPVDNTDPLCVRCHGKQVRFSHAAHVSIEGKVGARCELCHPPTPLGVRFASPAHRECWKCHDITLLGLTDGCNLCHLEQAKGAKAFDMDRADLRHKQHLRLGCLECHEPILTARGLDEITAARMHSFEGACTRCHPDRRP